MTDSNKTSSKKSNNASNDQNQGNDRILEQQFAVNAAEHTSATIKLNQSVQDLTDHLKTRKRKLSSWDSALYDPNSTVTPQDLISDARQSRWSMDVVRVVKEKNKRKKKSKNWNEYFAELSDDIDAEPATMDQVYSEKASKILKKKHRNITSSDRAYLKAYHPQAARSLEYADLNMGNPMMQEAGLDPIKAGKGLLKLGKGLFKSGKAKAGTLAGGATIGAFGTKAVVTTASTFVKGAVGGITALLGALNIGISSLRWAIDKAITAIGKIKDWIIDAIKIGFKVVLAPFKIGMKLVEKAIALGNESREEIQKIEQSLSDTRDTFANISDGIGQRGGSKIARRLMGLRKAFWNPDGIYARTFGLDVAGIENTTTKTKEILDQMKNYSEFYYHIFGDIKSMTALNRLAGSLGLEAEGIAYHSQESVGQNKHIIKYMRDILLIREEISKSTNIDKMRLSKFYNQLRKDITNFDSLSTKNLLNISAGIIKLGVDVENVSEVMNKFSTFEDAAKSAAMLSQAFGMNLDALKLIETDNPLEVLEMIQKSLLETGRTFTSLNRHERRIIESNTGLNSKNIKALMMYRKQGYTMEAAQKKLEADKPINRQIAAINKLTVAIGTFKETMNIRTFTDGIDMIQKSFTRLITGTSGKSNIFVKLSREMQHFSNNVTRLNAKPILQLAHDRIMPLIKAYRSDGKALKEITQDAVKTFATMNRNQDEISKLWEKHLNKQRSKSIISEEDYKRQLQNSKDMNKWYTDHMKKEVDDMIARLGDAGYGFDSLKETVKLGLQTYGMGIRALNMFMKPFQKNFVEFTQDMQKKTQNNQHKLSETSQKIIDDVVKATGLSSQEVETFFTDLSDVVTTVGLTLTDIMWESFKGLMDKMKREWENNSSFFNLRIKPIVEPIFQGIMYYSKLAIRQILDFMYYDLGIPLKLFTAGQYDPEKNRAALEALKIANATRITKDSLGNIKKIKYDKTWTPEMRKKALIKAQEDVNEKLNTLETNKSVLSQERILLLTQKQRLSHDSKQYRQTVKALKYNKKQIDNLDIQLNAQKEIKKTLANSFSYIKKLKTIAIILDKMEKAQSLLESIPITNESETLRGDDGKYERRLEDLYERMALAEASWMPYSDAMNNVVDTTNRNMNSLIKQAKDNAYIFRLGDQSESTMQQTSALLQAENITAAEKKTLISNLQTFMENITATGYSVTTNDNKLWAQGVEKIHDNIISPLTKKLSSVLEADTNTQAKKRLKHIQRNRMYVEEMRHFDPDQLADSNIIIWDSSAPKGAWRDEGASELMMKAWRGLGERMINAGEGLAKFSDKLPFAYKDDTGQKHKQIEIWDPVKQKHVSLLSIVKEIQSKTYSGMMTEEDYKKYQTERVAMSIRQLHGIKSDIFGSTSKTAKISQFKLYQAIAKSIKDFKSSNDELRSYLDDNRLAKQVEWSEMKPEDAMKEYRKDTNDIYRMFDKEFRDFLWKNNRKLFERYKINRNDLDKINFGSPLEKESKDHVDAIKKLIESKTKPVKTSSVLPLTNTRMSSLDSNRSSSDAITRGEFMSQMTGLVTALTGMTVQFNDNVVGELTGPLGNSIFNKLLNGTGDFYYDENGNLVKKDGQPIAPWQKVPT